ncbi:cold-shock domain family protein [Methylocaldum marinum]|uniref:Cold-shock domain family protein n=1 Tax=Methylocaldum marinum TaxID=1432792 RepID=A0A250KYF0_9GAMM|nr:DUF1294 domain-containing protein [Methylocaldum marinum]BBA36655.1 cold-shock domain family protein [Methylocaldum marinum]
MTSPRVNKRKTAGRKRRVVADDSRLQEGILVLWNDDKGFGFVRPSMGGDDYFVHISVLEEGTSRRPQVGDTIFYNVASDTPGRRRLSYAAIKGVDVSEKKPTAGILASPRSPLLWTLIGLPILLSCYLMWRTYNPIPFFSYVFLSVLAIMLCGFDKKHAITGQWRVPELYMHVIEFMGGWPGALLAQHDFRHKIRKSRYRLILWGIIAFHGLAWTAFLVSNFVGR